MASLPHAWKSHGNRRFGFRNDQKDLLGAEVGFDAFFFALADYQDIIKCRKERTMEVIWQGSKSLGASAQEEDGPEEAFGKWWSRMSFHDQPWMMVFTLTALHDHDFPKVLRKAPLEGHTVVN